MATKTLLDTLANHVGCAYLSNLHSPYWVAQLAPVLDALDADAYGLAEWNDAVGYITATSSTFQSVEEAYAHLKAYVQGFAQTGSPLAR
nr:hypothetical protein [Maliibacterium massiliense]